MLNVVYHCAAMGNWKTVVAEQFTLLREAGLTNVNSVHLGEDLPWFLAEAKRQGINLRVDYHDGCLKKYEFPAMMLVEKIARVSPNPVLYFHTKGVSVPVDDHRQKWRKMMENHLIKDWRQNLQYLADHDTVGVNWIPCNNPPWITKLAWMRPHYTGNFWIATSAWIRSLPSFHRFLSDFYFLTEANMRFVAELWVGCLPWVRSKSLVCYDKPFWEPTFNFDTLEFSPPVVKILPTVCVR